VHEPRTSSSVESCRRDRRFSNQLESGTSSSAFAFFASPVCFRRSASLIGRKSVSSAPVHARGDP
jgi:hypothetical protein